MHLQVDLTGGWYVGAEPVKYAMPMAHALAVTSWGLLQFPDAHDKAGTLAASLEHVKWGAEYFIKATLQGSGGAGDVRFVAQVGPPEHQHDI